MMFRTAALLAAVVGSANAFTPRAPLTFVSRGATHTSASCGRSRFGLSMVAIDTSDIKNGLTIEIDGEPHKVLNFSVMKQARGAAKTTIKFKNLTRGNTIENTYRSGEKFQTAMVEKKKAQHTYSDENGNYFFMDSETFEEVMVEPKQMEGKTDWVGEGMEVNLVMFKDRCIDVDVPSTMVVEIVETEPNVKGNTAQGYTKPAKLSCGATINVPGFLEQGSMIKVDTGKGEYIERA